MEKFTQLKDLITSADKDAAKFYVKGNASEGTRLRKKLQIVKMPAQEIRKDITQRKNTRFEA